MRKVAFELPISDPEQIFELYWNALKHSVMDRNALPPKSAILISGSNVELINVQDLGGFSVLTDYIVSREEDTEYPLEACIISFEVVDKDTCDGKLIAVLFPGRDKPIAKMATWMLVGKKIYCEDYRAGLFSDYDCGEDLAGMMSPQIGYV